mgnify:CR=1 FL=1
MISKIITTIVVLVNINHVISTNIYTISRIYTIKILIITYYYDLHLLYKRYMEIGTRF